MLWAVPGTLKLAFHQWRICGGDKFFKKVWQAIFFIIIWSVWKERNDRIFNQKFSTLEEVQDLALVRLCWWIQAWGDEFPYSANEVPRNPQCLKRVKSPPIIPDPIPKLAQVWSPPPASQLKWNIDASFDHRLDNAAVGGVLRDELENFLCLFSSPIPQLEINSAEIYAIYRAIKISMSSERIKRHQLTLVSDSSNAVRWCNEDTGGPWNLNFVLNYIRNARKHWLCLEIIHKGRGAK